MYEERRNPAEVALNEEIYYKQEPDEQTKSQLEEIKIQIQAWQSKGREIITLASQCQEIDILTLAELTTFMCGIQAIDDLIKGKKRPFAVAAGALGVGANRFRL